METRKSGASLEIFGHVGRELCGRTIDGRSYKLVVSTAHDTAVITLNGVVLDSVSICGYDTYRRRDGRVVTGPTAISLAATGH